MNTHVLVGTRKGAWIYTSDETRQRWEVSEPIMPGWTARKRFSMPARLRRSR